jgi:hypothetical protein
MASAPFAGSEGGAEKEEEWGQLMQCVTKIKYYTTTAALKTTHTEVPGSIPGHSLGFF